MSDSKDHANSDHDFYAILSLPNAAASAEKEIRSAYRKAALKCHPDKIGPNDRFELVQIALDVLSDPVAKELYDNARRAREQKKERDAAFEGRRRAMKDDLEAREAGGKRKREEEGKEEAAFERELARLAADGKRRRTERAEALRKEMNAQDEEEQRREEGETANTLAKPQAEIGDIDRSVKLRFPQSDKTAHLTRDRIMELFSRIGPIDEVVLRDKKVKVDGEKHKKSYTTVMLLYRSIIGAHSAVTDFPSTAKSEQGDWSLLEAPSWASGQEPAFIPKPRQQPATPVSKPRPETQSLRETIAPSTPLGKANGDGGLRKVPSFGSFKGTPKVQNSPGLDDITMIRLKNAERRRVE